MRRLAAAVALVLLGLGSAEGQAGAQEPPPPRTTFRSTVDLVPVDVNVVDKKGRPVTDLTAADFTLAVDGQPRRIASAQFISVDRAAESDPPKPREYASNAGAQTGRLVMIAIDSGNIASGRGKQAIEAATRFVGTLKRNDRVALVTLPGAGPQIEFTSNHAIVQTLLGNVVGQAADSIGQKRIGLAEALAIDRNDRLVINEILLVLRAIYEARSAGRPIATVEADRALFIRYADAYKAANGPQQPLVAEWRKYVDK